MRSGQPNQTLHHGMPYLDDSAPAEERLGALHTEGLAESRANIYLKFAIAISASQRGDRQTLAALIYPDIDAGLEGVRWIENCVRSADNGATGLITNKESTMKLSFCTDSPGHLPFEQMLDRLLELGCAAWK